MFTQNFLFPDVSYKY